MPAMIAGGLPLKRTRGRPCCTPSLATSEKNSCGRCREQKVCTEPSSNGISVPFAACPQDHRWNLSESGARIGAMMLRVTCT